MSSIERVTKSILLDAEPAALHGVPTKVSVQAVKRSLNRFSLGPLLPTL